jgi:hypothetical protein
LDGGKLTIFLDRTDRVSPSKALLSEEVFEFVKANADQLDEAIDYKRHWTKRYTCGIA